MTNLEQGIAALKAGKLDDARNFFSQAISENKDDARVWGWMYNACKNDQERVACLKQIIRIDPTNEKAQNLLNNLTAPASTIPEPPLDLPPAKPLVIGLDQLNNTGKPNHSLRNILIAVVVCLVCVCMSLALLSSLSGTGNGNNGNLNPGGLSLSPQVRYRVYGSANGASITYMNATGGMEQIDAQLPFDKSFTLQSSVSLSLVAQNKGSGTITCEIWIRGKMTKTSTSTAQYGVVTCADIAY